LSGLSDERLSDLTAYSIEKAIHTLSVGDARSRAKRVLNIALNAAKRWGYIDRNPLDSARITIGANRHNKPIPYNARELDAVLSIFRGDIAEPTLLVLANCGLGKEEALALDWEDMDLDPDASLLSTQELDLGIIYIYKAWADDGDQIVEKATKNTHRERIVYVAGDALLRLRELKSGKSGPIWPGKVRSRVRPDAATRRFKLKVEKAGLRHIPLNNLRHTYATIALTKGLPLPVVSENLGHSQVSTTLRYTGASSALRMQSAVSFASFIDSQKQKNDKHNVKNG
jgi:integrase